MKKALALTLIMALLMSVVAGVLSANLASANPVAPPEGNGPPAPTVSPGFTIPSRQSLQKTGSNLHQKNSDSNSKRDKTLGIRGKSPKVQTKSSFVSTT